MPAPNVWTGSAALDQVSRGIAKSLTSKRAASILLRTMLNAGGRQLASLCEVSEHHALKMTKNARKHALEYGSTVRITGATMPP